MGLGLGFGFGLGFGLGLGLGLELGLELAREALAAVEVRKGEARDGDVGPARDRA